MILLRYLPTTDGCIAQVGLERVVVMSPAAAAQVMADFERLSDESLKRDPTDEWGLGVSWKQAAQAIGEALLTTQGVSGRAA